MWTFTLILLNIWIKPSLSDNSAECKEDQTFRKLVLEANSVCGPTTISKFDTDFLELAIDTGVAIAAQFTPLLASGRIVMDVLDGFNGDDSFGNALEEQWNALIMCMDSKINDYRQTEVEGDWSGYMHRYQNTMISLESGGNVDDAMDDIDSVLREMDGDIYKYFNTAPTKIEYLKTESLLFTLKSLSEVYWLAFVTHLALMKDAIQRPETEWNPIDYNNELDIGRDSLQRLKDWCHIALDVIEVMYEPTYKTDWLFNLIHFYIKWEEGNRKVEGICNGQCKTCFKDRITNEYNAYIRGLKSDYVDLYDKLYTNSMLIGYYGKTTYFRITSEGTWFHGCDNIDYYGDKDIKSVLSFCNNDVNCIGFSWSETNVVMKKGGYCPENGMGTSSVTPWVSIFKETAPLCYQKLFSGEFPDCTVCNSEETYFDISKRCDDDPQCLGFRWNAPLMNGCTFDEQCLSTYSGLFYSDSQWDYHGKCSRLDVEYPRTESGCSSTAADAQTVSDNVFACSGTIASGGVLGADAAALCSSSYHVCKSAIEVADKGVTAAMCAEIPGTTTNQFFATQESSGGYDQCTSEYPSNVGTNDVWGCKLGSTTAFASGSCGVLNGKIQNRNWGSWDLSSGTTTNEASTYKLTDAASGGVLCCKNDVSSGFSVHNINKMMMVSSGLAVCFMLILIYLWFIVQRFRQKNNGFIRIPKSIESDDENDL